MPQFKMRRCAAQFLELLTIYTETLHLKDAWSQFCITWLGIHTCCRRRGCRAIWVECFHMEEQLLQCPEGSPALRTPFGSMLTECCSASITTQTLKALS